MSHRAILKLIRLTPPGRGAVATLRIEGPGAAAIIAGRFATRSGRPLDQFPANRLVVGRFGGAEGEEVVVRPIAADAVELHCHGGLAAVGQIEDALVAAGCRQIAWQDWVAESETDPLAAAACVALAEARTPRTAAILLDQYRGALRRAIDAIKADLQAGRFDSARPRIDAILARAPLGLHLTRPWQVVVAGRPNVGKSSLLNAMAGYPRAIVHPTAGTTRDVVAVQTVLDGWPVELSDTAGLRAADDALEQAGIERAQAKLAEADLTLLVFDYGEAWSDSDDALRRLYRDALVVFNKIDRPVGPGARPPGLLASALESRGIDELCQAIAERLVPEPPPPDAAVPFTAEQVGMIREMLKGRG